MAEIHFKLKELDAIRASTKRISETQMRSRIRAQIREQLFSQDPVEALTEKVYEAIQKQLALETTNREVRPNSAQKLVVDIDQFQSPRVGGTRYAQEVNV